MASVPFFARRFIPGTTLMEGIAAAKELNKQKISATLDLLGENISDKLKAQECTTAYIQLLQQINQDKIDSHISIKLTMIGLDIDKEFCFENLLKILAVADSYNNRVALDMEGSAYTEPTLAIYEKACALHKSPEIVLQAYLKRTVMDIERVINANGRLRLCKGAYKENKDVAYQTQPEIQENYKKLIATLLLKSQHVCIASHDDEIINYCKKFIQENNIPEHRYEFQMLYGLRKKTWSDIRTGGYPMTVYIPYGEQWQAYYKRRLSERKENVFFILKNILRD